DVGQVISVLIPVLMFMSPIFYPVTALPEAYQGYLMMNPLTPVIEQARVVMYLGQLPDFTQLAFNSLVSLLIFWAGFAWFQKTRKGFADVL
ncbi:ABC transporter permease, partial [Stutzerimonas nitrititolerans]|uniref:ABC transporter permease n=1 Tax=Stutzerimonas nitrititolerans TaxID=2482751 RepID=UPI00289D0E55